MKREDEADADKKKLQNRCQKLEAKSDLLLSVQVTSRKKFKTTNIYPGSKSELNPESKFSLCVRKFLFKLSLGVSLDLIES